MGLLSLAACDRHLHHQGLKGQTVYTETRTIAPGDADFTWNGRGTNGTTLPDGAYSLDHSEGCQW